MQVCSGAIWWQGGFYSRSVVAVVSHMFVNVY